MTDDARPDEFETFIRMLPDPAGAQAFLARLDADPAVKLSHYRRDPSLITRLLTIAAYSPFLAETLLKHPEHIGWLQRESETHFDRVKSTEQLSEDLARFVTRITDADHQTRLARFKRRELLRIYLRDCLGVATLSEVTEELSNLADVILGHALALARQEVINTYGPPQTRDERGRIEQAKFAIVALGKLGCAELNYASDIDLLFLYSGAGSTAGDGRNPESSVSNKEFFTAVANRLAQMIGSHGTEGAVYRTDLRLRPYGRDGDMVWDTDRAIEYYRTKAQNWERQALIRARASAGSETVVARFLDRVRESVFAPGAVTSALAEVRRAKEKIDRAVASSGGGFNVKLGRGGIREIEFIVQALQLAYGGREPWLRSAQTLIVLARLAEKGYLTEDERARLSVAYTFLRTVEHRLQMEHGAQTHRLPVAPEKLSLLARRSGYLNTTDPAARFLADLDHHTSTVRNIYNSVFERSGAIQSAQAKYRPDEAEQSKAAIDDDRTRLINHASAAVSKLVEAEGQKGASIASSIQQAIMSALPSAINQTRSLRNLLAWSDSLATYARDNLKASGWRVSEDQWPQLISRLVPVLSSHYLSHILTSRPALANVILEAETRSEPRDYLQALGSAISQEDNLSAKADALRRAWYRLVIEIGYRDMAGASGQAARPAEQSRTETSNLKSEISNLKPEALSNQPLALELRANNIEQTALAESALRLAVEMVVESFGVASTEANNLPFAVLALGRLGHTGMDYGSDLDLLIVFDDERGWPPRQISSSVETNHALTGLSPQEFYARLAARLVQILSSITREGLLYRVDLRLRPDGASGPLACSLSSLVTYLCSRASAWEHSAYLKAREVAGHPEFGARVREMIIETTFDAASANESLKDDLHLIRMRLEKEKARGAQANIKWGAGGMTDVYFITRYLQLRDRIRFPTERGTTALVLHLGERLALDGKQTEALYKGYMFLRMVDHWIRLLLDRPGPVLPASDIALGEIARALGLGSITDFDRAFAYHTSQIRDVYARVFEQ